MADVDSRPPAWSRKEEAAVGYEWVPVPGAELVPGPRSFFARSGADRYARIARAGTPR